METPIIPSTLPQNEHDLLVTIHGQVGRALTDIKDVKDDVKELKDGVTDRISRLEENKINKIDIANMQLMDDKIHLDFETRLRVVEKQSDETNTQISTTSKTWGIVATILTLLLAGFSIYLSYHH